MAYRIDDNVPLPPGHVNMGDASKLDLSQFADKIQANNTAAGNSTIKASPIVWEERIVSETITEYRPVITVLNLARFELGWRMQRLFFAGELLAYQQVVSNVVSEYIFGVSPFLESEESGGIKLTPNPEWMEYVKTNTLDGFKKRKTDTSYAEAKDMEDDSLLPMEFTDPEGNTTGFLTCNRMIKSDSRSFPVVLTLSYVSTDGTVMKEQNYQQQIEEKKE